MVLIRDARHEDLDRLMPLFEEIFSRSPFAERFNLDRLRIYRMLAVGCAMPNFFTKVVEEDDEVVGFMAGAIDENVFGAKVATDLFLYSKRDTHRLIRQFRAWAVERGAHAVSLNNISGDERLDKLIEALGIPPVGRKYMEIL